MEFGTKKVLRPSPKLWVQTVFLNPGVYFAGAERYRFYSRYAPPDDLRRFARPAVGVAHRCQMWNIKDDIQPTPRKRTMYRFIS